MGPETTTRSRLPGRRRYGPSVTRTLFAGGEVFDGTGAAPAPADVLVEDGLIADIGSGLDADDVVECSSTTLLPGLIDSHVHVLFRG